MKHGRKEQFSITISTELADEIYEYMEKHNILYKNMVFEQIMQKGFAFGKIMDKQPEKERLLFNAGFGSAMDIALQFSKSKLLKKAIKVHYDSVEQHLQDALSIINSD